MRMKEAYLDESGVRISTVTGKPVRIYTKKSVNYWGPAIKSGMTRKAKKNVVGQEVIEEVKKSEIEELYTPEEIELLIDRKKNAASIELVKFERNVSSDEEANVGIIVASDWHADETVKSSTVLGKNEFNKDTAQKRIHTFFENAVKVMGMKHIDELVFAALGDMLGGWIHDELAQTNSMSPMEAVSMVKKEIVSGLKFIHESFPGLKKFRFIGICGNHSRTTKKMQFANGYKLSYEYFMYKDIESTCEVLGLPIEFVIPESEFAYIDLYGKKVIFCHGHQFNTAGGVGGIYPSMLRWFGKLNQTVKVDKAFIGHYHTSIWTKEVCVNGSIKGYDAFAMGHALPFEVPQQTFVIMNEKRGFIFYTPIFVE